MTISPSAWATWIDVTDEDIKAGIAIDDDPSKFLDDLLCNLEYLREHVIDTQFLEVEITSASYVSVISKDIYIPQLTDHPVSNPASRLNFQTSFQSYQSGGATSHDVRIRVNGGTWRSKTGLTTTSWSAVEVLTILESEWDPDSASNSVVTYEVEALVTGGGSVFVRDRSVCSVIRRTTP
jgi:hypothetical protein